jgi:broad specificity polyphosphatase/5'/3'-nucleotidase SurE
MKRRASASAWFVTVQVFTTMTSASARAVVVVAPLASASWRMRSLSYWFALQPNVW